MKTRRCGIPSISYAKNRRTGSLAVEAFVCHPDWDEPQKIALVKSRPQDRDAKKPTLSCDLGPAAA